MSEITIYHNPKCGTSRNTLAMIRHTGVEPTVIEYLKEPPSREALKALLGRMGLGVRDILRQKGTPFNQPCCGSVFKNPKLPDGWADDAPRTAGQCIERVGLFRFRAIASHAHPSRTLPACSGAVDFARLFTTVVPLK